MAYMGKNDNFPVWLPESLPEDILSCASIHLVGEEEESDGAVGASEPANGFIVHDWFGPFLLSPPTRFLRGQC